MMATTGMVTFIGSGPGDPELLTLKGQKLLALADVVLYAGSLVPEEILNYARPKAERYNTAGMKLAQQVTLMVEAAQQGKQIARLHTGDPSIFGAIHEQIDALMAAGIPYRIIPGVSSAFAAAAALGIEYTLPEVTQTVILTRQSGRTPVPEAENLRSLAAHHSSLVIFLSTGLLHEVVTELRSAGYAPETPVALVYRASWPDERCLRGTLVNIAKLAEAQELTHQGLIIVSPALETSAQTTSHLYGNFQSSPGQRKGTAILALTTPAIQLGRILLESLPGALLYLPARLSDAEDSGKSNIILFQESVRQALQSAFMEHESLVCIMAAGIVMRELAPLLKNKHSDPAVVIMDNEGHFAVSLLSGHEGGANRLAHQIARVTGGQAVITTASDTQDISALDILAKEHGWKNHPDSQLARVMAALVNGHPVALVADENLILPDEIANIPWIAKFTDWQEAVSSGFQQLVVLTCQQIPQQFWETAPGSVVYHLPLLAVGVGCNRGTGSEEIITAIQNTLDEAGLAIESICCVATIIDKADEIGLIEACRSSNWELCVFDRDQVRQIENLPNPSTYAFKALGVLGVAEPAALLASGANTLLVEKHKYTNTTVAIARKENAEWPE